MVFSETLRDPEVFIDAACRAAELDKPVVLLEGRAAPRPRPRRPSATPPRSSARPGCSTRSARQYGVFVVDTMEEMLDLGMIFQDGRRVRDRRWAIMTSSGGAGVLLADACAWPRA